MNSPKLTKAVYVKLDRVTHKRWKHCSVAFEMSISDMIRRAVAEFIERLEPDKEN